MAHSKTDSEGSNLPAGILNNHLNSSQASCTIKISLFSDFIQTPTTITLMSPNDLNKNLITNHILQILNY
jgi:hypothetical protein